MALLDKAHKTLANMQSSYAVGNKQLLKRMLVLHCK